MFRRVEVYKPSSNAAFSLQEPPLDPPQTVRNCPSSVRIMPPRRLPLPGERTEARRDTPKFLINEQVRSAH